MEIVENGKCGKSELWNMGILENGNCEKWKLLKMEMIEIVENGK